MQPTRLPKKKDVALALLEQATVFVHLDPRSDKVSVPPWFKRQPQLVLQIGLNMAIPIVDLEVDEAGLSCTLSFDRAPHHCQVPWNAIFALVGENGRGMVWPDDVPPEVAAEAERQARAAQAKARLASAPPPAPSKAEANEAPADAPAKKKRKRASKSKSTESKPVKESKAAAQPARAVQPARKPSAEPAPARRVARSAGEATSSGGTKRKRVLPPYLRVVK